MRSDWLERLAQALNAADEPMAETAPASSRAADPALADAFAELARRGESALSTLHLALFELGDPRRKGLGAFYTPPSIAAELARRCLAALAPSPSSDTPLRALDPACGDGALLLALADQRPRPPLRLIGRDIDRQALRVLELRAPLRPAAPSSVSLELRCGDALDEPDGAPDDPLDLILMNPPYGLKSERARGLGLRSKDILGPFLLLGRRLRPGGVLGAIVSDTFLTLESHEPLRRRLLAEFAIERIARLSSDTFDATVETVSLVARRRERPLSITNRDGAAPPTGETLRLSRLRRPVPGDAHGDWAEEVEQSHATADLLELPGAPFSVLRPSLLELLVCGARGGESRGLRWTTLGELATVAVGVQTGDNHAYLFATPEAHGRYRLLDPERLLRPEELAGLRREERERGVEPERYQGRHLVPFDKGGRSLDETRSLAAWWRPLLYAIDWSRDAVTRMRTLRSPTNPGRLRSRLQNLELGFRPFLVASRVGRYAPTYVLGQGGLFDSGCTAVIPRAGVDPESLLAWLGSRFARTLLKGAVNHTVNTQADDLKRLPLPTPEAWPPALPELTRRLVEARREGAPRAGLLAELNATIARAIGLDADEQRELEEFCDRRYPGIEL